MVRGRGALDSGGHAAGLLSPSADLDADAIDRDGRALHGRDGHPAGWDVKLDKQSTAAPRCAARKLPSRDSAGLKGAAAPDVPLGRAGHQCPETTVPNEISLIRCALSQTERGPTAACWKWRPIRMGTTGQPSLIFSRNRVLRKAGHSDLTIRVLMSSSQSKPFLRYMAARSSSPSWSQLGVSRHCGAPSCFACSTAAASS